MEYNGSGVADVKREGTRIFHSPVPIAMNSGKCFGLASFRQNHDRQSSGAQKESSMKERQETFSPLAAVYYKCVGTNYSTFIKGQIYHRDTIGKYLEEYPKDWKKVLPYPTTHQLLAAFEKNERVSQVIRALKQWSNCR